MNIRDTTYSCSQATIHFRKKEFALYAKYIVEYFDFCNMKTLNNHLPCSVFYCYEDQIKINVSLAW